MLQMMKGLDLERYEPRLYIVSEGDQFSAEKAAEFETGSSFPEAFSVTTIPRARKVLQPIWTVPFTASISFFICVKEFTLKPWLQGKPFADLLLLNGPGTCIPLFATVFLNRVLGMQSPRVIYIESFTRVKTLSLSGRILRPLVDRFVVQWPNLTRKGEKERYSGWLI
ncbi:UDP-N-acetylglucosamine transferase subunit [Serendipita sp. 411]|nr:UDP-N-acetylglucosamine transferase subunit [Serendipita sp. 397]KAG8848071.1 UDP-N-acetylglucosamine transferase subunit [Serendipita sp. 411]KAG8869554.1 UDP-N-acetylglucosamine transferase subunit [Serendipita sp. 405]